MPFEIVREDITKMNVDAIVNAANTSLLMGGGVCGAIFAAAGASELQNACGKLAPVETGEAVITPGFNLPAKFIIHTPGPVWSGGSSGEEKLLRSCYLNSLRLAEENGVESVAFPLISSGIYGYPKKDALKAATRAITDFITEYDMNVYLAVFDKESLSINEKLIGEFDNYAKERLADRRELLGFEMWRMKGTPAVSAGAGVMFVAGGAIMPAAGLLGISASHWTKKMSATPKPPKSLDDLIGHLDESFAQTLLRLIDAKGKTDAEIYKRANIDRRLFSKIRNNANYTPSKQTVIAFAVALELNLDETSDLLNRAGYSLSPSRMFDVIVGFFIANGKYNIFEINEALFRYDQLLLGSSAA
ncbi:MAG: macro domain-containing protein [Synergistaceae bacterium]|jgi:O-acetyl-ADP-ribose deacetylase (regulator of RNase III)/transcriptional regulator with XRE-family HTH domain|nr:macro domain-containing protein [Synergistaceae bacterium]